MRLLVVNWQDRENPQAGGAEIHLHEIFGRIARNGHEVTLLCGGWTGVPAAIILDGMRVLRVGTRYSFPFLARRYYQANLARERADVLVEDINKVPLHTPRWGASKNVALVPHLFGSTVFQEAAFPLASAVWLAERWLPNIYRRTPFQAISESTADDLVQRGIPRSAIRVIYPGIDTNRYTPDVAAREHSPLFVYLGRLKRYKGIELILRAFARLELSSARLVLAGAGDHRPALERLARSLDLGGNVRFLGFVSEEEKLALLRQAWALVFTSPKEGWGITNLEAAACATPVIASRSPGLRESVRDGETGFLVSHGDIEQLAAAMQRIAVSRALVERLGLQGREFAETFTWERAAAQTEAHLEQVASGHSSAEIMK